MQTFTLDTNCIIDLEENRPNACHIIDLRGLWNDGKVDLAVVSVSASENQKSGQAMPDYATIERKLRGVGLEHARELAPVGLYDFGYWDHVLWGDDKTDAEIDEIRNILFPGSNGKPPTDIELNSRWRNETCDVLVAWAHRHHRSDHLVTNDTNFHKKASGLNALGIASILTPQQAVGVANAT